MVWTCFKKEQRENPKEGFKHETKRKSSESKTHGHDLLPEVEMLNEEEQRVS
jgi:hypothetical protein